MAAADSAAAEVLVATATEADSSSQASAAWYSPAARSRKTRLTAAAGGLGGLGGSNGATGQGIGGGVYLSSTGSTETGTKIKGNTASTSHNNIYGSFGS